MVKKCKRGLHLLEGENAIIDKRDGSLCCRACKNAAKRRWQKRWRDANPETNRQRLKVAQRKYGLANKDLIKRMRLERPCADCGQASTDFHHPNSESKCFGLGGSGRKGPGIRSHAAVAAEIQKCVALCSSCHRKRHKPDWGYQGAARRWEELKDLV